jgi:hypothetical protein
VLLKELHVTKNCFIVDQVRSEINNLFITFLGTNFHLFASDSELRMLSESSELFLDGNFKFRPIGSQQVYRVFALVRGTFCLPVITAVMNQRKKSDYKELFR